MRTRLVLGVIVAALILAGVGVCRRGEQRSEAADERSPAAFEKTRKPPRLPREQSDHLVEVTHTADLVVGVDKLAITGFVVDADGRPFTGRFDVVAPHRNAMGYVARGGTQGSPRDGGAFSIEDLPATEMPVDVVITPRDAALPRVTLQRATMGGPPLRVELPRSAHIGGGVSGATKEELSYTYVFIQAVDDPDWSQAAADATGRFVTDRPVRIGPKYDVIAYTTTSPGLGAVRRGVSAGQTDVALELRPMLPLRGRLLDFDREPGTTCMVEGWATNPPQWNLPFEIFAEVHGDEDGAFEVLGVPGLSYWLVARTGEGAYAGTEIAFASGAEGIEIRFPREASVAGKLSDADGKPIEGAVVRAARAEDADRPWLCAVAEATKDGSFRIDGVPAGRVRLVTWRKGREIPLGDVDAPAASLDLRVPR